MAPIALAFAGVVKVSHAPVGQKQVVVPKDRDLARLSRVMNEYMNTGHSLRRLSAVLLLRIWSGSAVI